MIILSRPLRFSRWPYIFKIFNSETQFNLMQPLHFESFDQIIVFLSVT